MRDRVLLTFGKREYALLPTFAVAERFEDRFGSLISHLQALSELSPTATLKQRSYLVYLAMKAAKEEDNEPSDLSWEATHQAMWDEGMAQPDRVMKEIELIERLLYTPDQYLAKKAQAAAAAKEQEDMMGLLGGFIGSSGSPSPGLDGSHLNSGEQPHENSSPP
jgi:hypothetical protein